MKGRVDEHIHQLNRIIKSGLVLFVLICFQSCNEEGPIETGYFDTGEVRYKMYQDKRDSSVVCTAFYRKDGTKHEYNCKKFDGKGYLFHGVSKKYFSDGRSLRRVDHYANGSLNGSSILYNKQGEIKERINYLSGKRNGSAIFFFPNGEVQAWNLYKDDQLYYKHINDNYGKNVFKSPYPVVLLNKDTFETGDTLEVDFTMPQIPDSLFSFKEDSLKIRFDFSPKRERTREDKYKYPTQTVPLTYEPVRRSFIMEDTGATVLYGLIEGVANNDTTWYDLFTREFYLKPKG